MRIIGFVGKTGTGKSTLAPKIAKENDLDYIIDDGLLINQTDNYAVAGFGEKVDGLIQGYDNPSLSYLIMAKIALFEYNNADIVKEAINKINPGGILILGTSNKMVDKISKNLSLPEVQRTIYIKDILNEDDIHKAKISRENGGHSIPINHNQVEEMLNCFRKVYGDNIKLKAVNRKDHVVIEREY